MSTFSDISAKLDKALIEVNNKKDNLDKATEAATVAGNEYQKSVDNAQGLKKQLEDSLASVLPNTSGRVRVAG